MTFDEFYAALQSATFYAGYPATEVSAEVLRRIHAHLIATGVDVSAVLAGTAPSDLVTSDELRALASAHSFCWHCYDELADLPSAPNCCGCPAFGDCDDEGCEAPGCKLERPSVPPFAAPPKPPDLARLRAMAERWRVKVERCAAFAEAVAPHLRAGHELELECARDALTELTAELDAIEKGAL